jgi:hypothetical protein
MNWEYYDKLKNPTKKIMELLHIIKKADSKKPDLSLL